jgi:hypothetical protein
MNELMIKSQLLPGRIGENRKDSNQKSASQPRFELDTLLVQVRRFSA